MTISNTIIQIKKSGATGNVPSSLGYGELALNYADGKLYYKNSSGVITYISTGGGGGSSSNSFATVIANSTSLFATNSNDILNFVAGNNISISANTQTKSITINSTATSSGGFPYVDLGFVTDTPASGSFDAGVLP